MSCFTIAESPTLQRLFPEAKLIHTVRDGRDAGSSKVSKRQKRSHPRDGFEGLRWWEGRLRNIERGVSRLEDRSKLLSDQPRRPRRRRPRGRLRARSSSSPASTTSPAMRALLRRRDERRRGPQGALARGPTEQRQADLVREYEKTLDRLEREGFHCARVLRAAYERQPA